MEVDVEHAIERFFAARPHRLDRRCDPGVGDHDVDATERPDHLLDRRVEMRAIGDVAVQSERTRSKATALRLGQCFVDIHDDNRCAPGMEALRGVEADTARGARDEHDFAVEIHIRHSLSVRPATKSFGRVVGVQHQSMKIDAGITDLAESHKFRRYVAHVTIDYKGPRLCHRHVGDCGRATARDRNQTDRCRPGRVTRSRM